MIATQRMLDPDDILADFAADIVCEAVDKMIIAVENESAANNSDDIYDSVQGENDE